MGNLYGMSMDWHLFFRGKTKVRVKWKIVLTDTPNWGYNKNGKKV